jgi:GNAT superfamily N-acetyltransferase
MIFADLELARRLEAVEAAGARGFALARRRLDSSSAAEWKDVAGATAVFDGVASPVTQTFGLGLAGEVKAAHLDELEAFFRERGAAVFHEVSPLAGVELFQLLVARGYRPVELTSVMYQPMHSVTVAEVGALTTRAMAAGEEEIWSDVAMRGWVGEHPEYREFLLESGRLTAHSEGAYSYFAECDGQLGATAVLRVHEGVALLAGAATVPEARRRGAQQALLAARIARARESGCDLLMMCAQPGSGSQRNAERQGFRVAYTRVKWELISA